jgi:DNA-binding Lrp family transcriptional regulator
MTAPRVDELDQQIISCLLADARSSFREIGDRVGLSAPAVKRRVDRLRDDGVIAGFTARLDPAAVGWNTQAFVAVTYRGNITPTRIRDLLSRIPEVVAAYTVSGGADVLVQLRAADMAHFELALERLRSADAVDRTESTIVLSTVLERSAPVERAD